MKIEKIGLVARNKINGNFRGSIKKFGFKYSKSDPDLVISLGGDGTYLFSERLYPGIPKLLVKDSKICKKCGVDFFEKHVLETIKKGRFRIQENMKLEASLKRKGEVIKKFWCVNDFCVRNKEPIYALRFQVKVNGKQIDDTLIGDGVIISTPFGSTAYYQSIARKTFKKGIGVAFNNTTKKVRHLVLDVDSKIQVKIIREKAVLSCDNYPKIINLKEGDVVEIRKSREIAKIVKFIY